MKSQFIEFGLDLVARTFMYTVPYDGASVGVFLGKQANVQLTWLAGAAGFQALFMYLFILSKRPEFTKQQWANFGLFSLPAVILVLFGTDWFPVFGARGHGWAWLGGAALLFMGFRQHLDSMQIPTNLWQAQKASKEIEKHSGLSLSKKALVASLLALPFLGLNGITYAAAILVFLCIFRVDARRAWLVSLIISSPVLFMRQLSSSADFFNQQVPDFLPIVLVYLVGTVLAFFGAVVTEKILLGGKERQLAFAQMIPAMLVLAFTAHFEKRHVFSGMPVMGTEAKLIVWGDEGKAQNVRNEMLEIYAKINDSLSLYQDDSEISLLNKSAHLEPVKCSDLLWENVILAKSMYDLTEGNFDVTVGPLMRLWGFYSKQGEAPSDQEIDEVLKITGFDKIVLDPEQKTVFFKVEGMVLDFGGITKGYAVDKVIEMLQKRGYERGLVDLGGNIRVLKESPPDREFYPMGIRDPRNQAHQITRVDMLNNAISTSGNYERYVTYKGVRYPHIINPKTGRPQMGVDSVSVICPEAVYADALSTAFFLGGEQLLNRLDGTFKELSVMMLDFDDKGQLEQSILRGPHVEGCQLSLRGEK
ncbi:thiamin biosynthesis lipoprotein [Lentisphaera araneosa HTCC2155]|uniref:FAD:protein FMN transferase n=1 Tax=Lentisphaera araneosa HTCC2155 TaxID=313628 RepID=A6DSU0_9BACT|nr:FAD:protein FMN transferase [Lentisphaera araneosa]EDM25343.1 thiamin biosynthesis lipoprotein [Lentisphaera araneosa HTCC2155]